MKHKILIVVAALLLAVLAWWLLRPAPTAPVVAPTAAPPAAERSKRPLPPGAVRGAPVDRGDLPAVHLPQLLTGPGDIDPERANGPSNIPPGTSRPREAPSGKLMHYVIEEYEESFRECYGQHAASSPDLPRQALLEFTISADPKDTGDQFGSVSEVQVLTGGDDYGQDTFGDFERCCAEAVAELELDPPGGRRGGSMRFGMTIDLVQAAPPPSGGNN